MEFVKYHSLGNDCILLDKYLRSEKSTNLSAKMVASLCDRHFGVGADAVLVIEKGINDQPLMRVYNSDGSRAETCFNGLRCVADYVYRTYGFPDQFCVQTEAQQTTCTIIHDDTSSGWKIRTDVGPFLYHGKKEIATSQGSFLGHVVSVGNPHFVIFQKQSSDWVREHGQEIESHILFPQKTNVEFVSLSEKHTYPVYNLIVYERGCGITLACGSGAAAVAAVLSELGEIGLGQEFCIQMRGGNLQVCVTQQKTVVLEASATRVFRGHTEN